MPFDRHVIAHSNSGAVIVHSAIARCAFLLLIFLFMNYNSSDLNMFPVLGIQLPKSGSEVNSMEKVYMDQGDNSSDMAQVL